ncbi:MAG: Type secretion system protein [Chthoniobacter sp.]|nr:Type secretion system protein [Chthoniobacter sp.]
MSASPKSRTVWFGVVIGFVCGVLFSSAGLIALPVITLPKIKDGADKGKARREVKLIYAAMEAYENQYHALPTGDTAAIIAKLSGTNARELKFLKPLPRSQDSQGHLLDPWGSPYRIDVSDPANPKVWSPGKNKKDEPDDPHSDDICSWR